MRKRYAEDQFGRPIQQRQPSVSSSSSSKHGSKRLKNDRTSMTYLIFLVFLVNVLALFLSRGWLDAFLYLVCAILVGGLRGFSKLPKRYMTGIGVALLIAPLLFWLLSFVSGVFPTTSSSSSISTSSSSSTSTPVNSASTTTSTSTTTSRTPTPPGTTTTILVPIYSTIATTQPLTLHCPPRAVISSIDFASYGTPTSCVGWKSTTGCNPNGPRDNTSDLGCEQQVPSARSGYCECNDGTRRVESACNHPTFTCKQECERVVNCVGWRATTNCDPHKGSPSTTLSSCDRIVAPHESGYCECSNGTRVLHSTCDHVPFTCEDACTSGVARYPPFTIDSSCHHERSMPMIQRECPTGRTTCSLAAGWAESLFEYDEVCPIHMYCVSCISENEKTNIFFLLLPFFHSSPCHSMSVTMTHVLLFLANGNFMCE